MLNYVAAFQYILNIKFNLNPWSDNNSYPDISGLKEYKNLIVENLKRYFSCPF